MDREREREKKRGLKKGRVMMAWEHMGGVWKHIGREETPQRLPR